MITWDEVNKIAKIELHGTDTTRLYYLYNVYCSQDKKVLRRKRDAKM